MSATSAMVEKLRRMVDEPTTTTYSDDDLEGYIEDYPVIDAIGNDPFDIDYTTTPPTISENSYWIPTYDLHAAAAEIWEEKAAAIADEFDFSADGGNYSRKQRYENFMNKARHHLARRSAKASKIHVSPRPERREPTNED